MINIEIKVRQLSKTNTTTTFEVNIITGETQTKHLVYLDNADYQELTAGKITPEELVRKTMEFLLQKKPKESILRELDIGQISGYLPEYPEQVKEWLKDLPATEDDLSSTR